MNVNCIACNVEMNVPYHVVAFDPYREDFYCEPCEDDLEARQYGWVTNFDDYALASVGWGNDEDY